MKGIFNKVKWIIALSVVFLLILATNLTDRMHFQQVKDSVITIYEDRLVVKDIILKISSLIERKKLAIALSDNDYYTLENPVVNDSLYALVDQFYATKLTQEEAKFLDLLKEKIDKLEKVENDYLKSIDPEQRETLTAKINQLLDEMKRTLTSLSRIQLEEGRRQLHIATRAMDSIEFFTRMEIIFLVIIGLAIQFAILYTPRR